MRLTISSLQMGQNSLVLAAVTAGAPPFSKDTLELKSWLSSGSGDVARGEAESLDSNEMVLSEGEIRLELR